MGLLYNSRTIADVRISGVSGKRGIGFHQVLFSVNFDLPAWTEQEGAKVTTLTDLRAEISAGTSRGNLKLLGYAEPEAPLLFTPKTISQRSAALFLLNLSGQQLFVLEELRGGSGLYLQFTLTGRAQGTGGECYPAREDIHYQVNLSDWTRVLGELSYVDYLLLGVELPSVVEGDRLRTAATLIRHAHVDLLAGRYDDVVAKCRKVLESVQAALGEGDRASGALEKFTKGQKRAMSKMERELVIGEAVRHYTHPAHHVDDSGESEWYSRADATFILALTAAVVSSATGRFQYVQPE